MAATFQDVHKAQDVAIYIGVRILQGITHTRLGGKVNDAVELFSSKQPRDTLPVDHVHLDKTKARVRREPIEATFFQGDIVIVIEIVQPHDLVAARQQAQCGAHANEAGRSRQ